MYSLLTRNFAGLWQALHFWVLWLNRSVCDRETDIYEWMAYGNERENPVSVYFSCRTPTTMTFSLMFILSRVTNRRFLTVSYNDIFMYVPCILSTVFISTNNVKYIFFILTIFMLQSLLHIRYFVSSSGSSKVVHRKIK